MNIGTELMLYWEYQRSSSITALAKELKITGATLYYWQTHNHIPFKYWKKILDLTGFDVQSKLTIDEIQAAKDRRRSGNGGGKLGPQKKVC